MGRKEERETIVRFCVHINKVRRANLYVDEWPDANNLPQPEIDAIIKGGEKDIALELTSMESFKGQREDDGKLVKYFAPLEEYFRGKFNKRIGLTVPAHCLIPGYGWNEMVEILKRWLDQNIPLLHDGKKEHSINGVPFYITLAIDSRRIPSFRIGRPHPPDPESSDFLIDHLKKRINKLAPYKARDYETVLLVESYDIAWLTVEDIAAKLGEVIPRIKKPLPDQIWCALKYPGDSYEFGRMTLNDNH